MSSLKNIKKRLKQMSGKRSKNTRKNKRKKMKKTKRGKKSISQKLNKARSKAKVYTPKYLENKLTKKKKKKKRIKSGLRHNKKHTALAIGLGAAALVGTIGAALWLGGDGETAGDNFDLTAAKAAGNTIVQACIENPPAPPATCPSADSFFNSSDSFRAYLDTSRGEHGVWTWVNDSNHDGRFDLAGRGGADLFIDIDPPPPQLNNGETDPAWIYNYAEGPQAEQNCRRFAEAVDAGGGNLDSTPLDNFEWNGGTPDDSSWNIEHFTSDLNLHPGEYLERTTSINDPLRGLYKVVGGLDIDGHPSSTEGDILSFGLDGQPKLHDSLHFALPDPAAAAGSLASRGHVPVPEGRPIIWSDWSPRDQYPSVPVRAAGGDIHWVPRPPDPILNMQDRGADLAAGDDGPQTSLMVTPELIRQTPTTRTVLENPGRLGAFNEEPLNQMIFARGANTGGILATDPTAESWGWYLEGDNSSAADSEGLNLNYAQTQALCGGAWDGRHDCVINYYDKTTNDSILATIPHTMRPGGGEFLRILTVPEGGQADDVTFGGGGDHDLVICIGNNNTCSTSALLDAREAPGMMGGRSAVFPPRGNWGGDPGTVGEPGTAAERRRGITVSYDDAGWDP